MDGCKGFRKITLAAAWGWMDWDRKVGLLQFFGLKMNNEKRGE